MESNELMGYAITIVIVIILVYFQFKIFSNNHKLIKDVQNLFPSKKKLSIVQTTTSKDRTEEGIDKAESTSESIKVSNYIK